MLILIGKLINCCIICQVDVLEPRLRVALQNSQHSFDGECPQFKPSNAQNLLLGYAEEAHNENLSGSIFFYFFISDVQTSES